MNRRDAAKRRKLPLLSDHIGGRSQLTCLYRCGDACSHPVPNTSDNPYMGDLIASAVSRRSLFKAGVVVTVGAGAAGALGGAAYAFEPTTAQASRRLWGSIPRGLRFDAVEPNKEDAVTIPEGYEQQVVIRWGDPILDDAREFDPAAQTPEDAAGQFGYNCDFLALLDLPGERRRKVLVANHEYTSESMMHYGYDSAAPTREQVEIGWASHGLSVVVLKEDGHSGDLTPVVGHELNRRITATSEFVICGPGRRERPAQDHRRRRGCSRAWAR